MKLLHEYSVFCKLVRQFGDVFSDKFDKKETKNMKQNISFIQRSGWERIAFTTEKNTFGYYGMAYRRGEEIVIVHRGTQFYELGNLAADLLLAMGKPNNPILDEAETFTTQCIEELDLTPNTKITHVGFSLGAYIAATMAVRNVPNDQVKAVTFDSPGVIPQDHKPNDSQLKNRVRNYFLDPNLVNTCNKHNGSKYHVTYDTINKPPEKQYDIHIHDLFSVMSPSSSSPRPDCTFQELQFWLEESKLQQRSSESAQKFAEVVIDAFSSHKIEGFIDFFANPPELLKRVHSWPEASIEFQYGERKLVAPQFRNIFEALGHLFQGVTNIFANTLFNMTLNENNEGVVGIRYERNDQIVYSIDHNVSKIAEFTLMTINLLSFLLDPVQSSRQTPNSTYAPHSAFTTGKDWRQHSSDFEASQGASSTNNQL